MKLHLCYSHFSLSESHAKSIKHLNDMFKEVSDFKQSIDYEDVSMNIANDILITKYYGLSIQEQVLNLTNQDQMYLATFQNRLFQEWFNGDNFSLSTEELICKSTQPKSDLKDGYYVGYLPKINHYNIHNKVKDVCEINNKYDYLLSYYPIDNKSWYRRAKSRYLNLFFQEEAGSTLNKVDDGFCNYTIAFTKCMIALNDFSPTGIISTKDKVKHINALTTYECTEEGNSHQNFKFKFSENDKVVNSLDCQFHLKPSENNRVGDQTFYYKRLYFGFFPIDTNQWQVAVAAIGPHITTHNKKDRYEKPRR